MAGSIFSVSWTNSGMLPMGFITANNDRVASVNFSIMNISRFFEGFAYYIKNLSELFRMSENIINIILGILSCGGVGFLAFFLTSKIGAKTQVMEAVHNLTQKQKEDKINNINKSQVPLRVKIDENEKLSKKTVKKIKSIQEKASKEIEEILKEEKIEKINLEVDTLWEEI